MPTLSSVTRINITKVVSATPTISAAAYTAVQQVGGIMTLTDCVRQDTQTLIGNSVLASVTILDKAKQNAAIDIFFFNTSPTLISTDHTTFDLTDANLVAQCIGVVSVGSAYSSTNSNAASTTSNLNVPLQIANTATNPTNIYAVAVSRGTPTYASTSDLQFQFGFFID